MSIELLGEARRGRFRLDVDLEVSTGRRLALLGENGSGKTSILRLIAGLDRLETGSVSIAGSTVDDPDRGVWVPPEQRRVGYVPQQPWLFPHLSVARNVAFGPRRRGESRPESARLADEWLTRVGLADRATSPVRELSGGEAQRVAFARALAAEPATLLLDEPLASVDQELRTRLRRIIRDDLVTSSRTTVVVTHDPVDALALADLVAVVDNGRIAQTGTPLEVTSRPRSAFVARLAGLNLLEGVGSGHELRLDDGSVVVTASAVPARALATVAPRAVAVHRAEPGGSPRNTWPAEVVDLESVGDRFRVEMTGPMSLVAEVTPAAVDELALGPGERVWLAVKATEIDVYPA